jgi:hypothetical protein
MLPALRSVVFALFLAAACSRPDPEPAPPPAPSEPWPAQARTSAQRSQRVRFIIAKPSEAAFELKTRKTRHAGTVRVARGELDIDLLNLEATRGQVEMDLTSIRMQDDEGEVDRHASARAQNWLDLGSSRPAAARDRFRWARFVIESVTELSAEAAHEGRREKLPDPPDAGAGGAPGAPRGEVRRVDLTVKGQLRLHGYEVVQVVSLRAAFHYAAPATAGAVPTRVEFTTRRTFPVGLAAHDVRPRDALGTVIASEIELIGTEVAREARVSLQLAARPVRGSADAE